MDKLYPGTFSLLEDLARKHELFLVSRNEPGRENRIKELGIEGFFKKAVFSNDKSKELFSDLAGDSKEVFIVGDSIYDEIRTGNELGFTTVRLKRGKFFDQLPLSKKEEASFTIRDINELKEITSKYEK